MTALTVERELDAFDTPDVPLLYEVDRVALARAVDAVERRDGGRGFRPHPEERAGIVEHLLDRGYGRGTIATRLHLGTATVRQIETAWRKRTRRAA